MSNSTTIIAEIGVNHNGDVELAKTLISLAADAGVDFVKFQTFKSEAVICQAAPKAAYQETNTGNSESQLDMVKKLELSFDQHLALKAFAEQIGVGYLSTPFDVESLRFLMDIGLDTIKLPSGEITNYFLLNEAAQYPVNIILSTGMSTIPEIQAAIELLRSKGKVKNITVLHCNTEYPTPFTDVNLAAMESMARELDCNIGYSDHTLGIEVPIAAVARGACMIEKHFTLSRQLPGPDHAASIEPDELKQMVRAIRNIEAAIGSDQKVVTQSEHKNIVIARKFLVAKGPIEMGERFSLANLDAKRTGNGGICPMEVASLIGKVAQKHYDHDEAIAFAELSATKGSQE